uniref:Uncharacterized protein n=2 Tax=Neisseria meningitidis TaxID=487 RepID=C6SHR2_NEIME|nr:hypothetical protein predicted by Glimmer/Critica [Neisseria meningitidis alpha275]
MARHCRESGNPERKISKKPFYPASLPAGRPAIAACAAMAGRGGGIFQVAAIFPNNSTAPIQAFRLVALSLALSHRERGRVGCWG